MQLHSHGGFTFIEVLVALFVLAIGVVGASAAQLAAQRTRQHAALSSEAAMLAASFAARMQANVPLAALPDGANPYLPFEYHAPEQGPPLGEASCFGVGACDPASLAAFDLHETRLAVHSRFPGGHVKVCRDAAPWDDAARRYRWACNEVASAPVAIKIGWYGADDAPAFVLMVAK